MFLKFDGALANDKFVSFVILSFQRFDFTHNLINSIHEYADVPFEIIVHDDASNAETQQKLFNIRDKISTLELSSGFNMGLSAAFNRGIALANSKYVILLNNDAIMVGPGLQDVMHVLDSPYVGIFGPWQTTTTPEDAFGAEIVRVKNEHGKVFYLGPLCGSGSIMALRKEVWQEIQGCNSYFCGASDTSFMRKLLKHGYFQATRLLRESEIFDNVDYHLGCANSVMGQGRFDNSYPMVFKAPGDFAKLCRDRQARIAQQTWKEEKEPAGLPNNDWWHLHIVNSCIREQNTYDWDKMPYHQRFREIIERDRIKP